MNDALDAWWVSLVLWRASLSRVSNFMRRTNDFRIALFTFGALENLGLLRSESALEHSGLLLHTGAFPVLGFFRSIDALDLVGFLR